MKLGTERIDYGHGTRIVADNGERGKSRVRLLVDLPDDIEPGDAVRLLRAFAAQIEQRIQFNETPAPRSLMDAGPPRTIARRTP